MPIVFASNIPGSVVRVDTRGRTPQQALVVFGTPATSKKSSKPQMSDMYDAAGLVVLGFSTDSQVAAQFIRGLVPGDLYGFVFGDEMVPIILSGIAPNSSCGNSGDGLKKLQNWYDANKMSTRQERLTLAIGGNVYQCYLLNMKLHNSDPETLMTQVQLTFAGIPKKTKTGKKGGASAAKT